MTGIRITNAKHPWTDEEGYLGIDIVSDKQEMILYYKKRYEREDWHTWINGMFGNGFGAFLFKRIVEDERA